MRRISGIFDTSYVQDMTIFRTRYYTAGMVILISVLFGLCLRYCRGFLARLHQLNGSNGDCSPGVEHTYLDTADRYRSGTRHSWQWVRTRRLFSRLSSICHLGYACLAAGSGQALTGILFGLPSLRVKGYYLALTTIAAQYLIIYMIKTPFPEITGGAIALSVPDAKAGQFCAEYGNSLLLFHNNDAASL